MNQSSLAMHDFLGSFFNSVREEKEMYKVTISNAYSSQSFECNTADTCKETVKRWHGKGYQIKVEEVKENTNKEEK